MNRAACTIVSPNYIAFARTLAESYIAQHPEQRFFVLIVADLDDPAPFQSEAFTAVMLPQVGVPGLQSVAMKFDILELNTNVKPTFLKFLMAEYGLDAVMYLDPDIFVYARLEPVFAELDRGVVAVLTPHMTTPVFDGRIPGEQEILYNGTYNLGFIAVRRCAEGTRLLDWWEQRCLELGFSEGRTGLFVDQKWMNLAPGMFEGISILRDAGCNMAYWNLHERTLESGEVGPVVVSPVSRRVPLRFFHYSGIVLTDTSILSKNTDRFTLAERPDLQALFAAYKAVVLGNKDAMIEALPYGFDTLSDGTAINRLSRRIYAAHAERWGDADPFSAQNDFAKFAKRMGLLKGKTAPQKTTWNDFKTKDRRVEAVHTMLRLALRLLGPVRYELLMRYLAHIAVLRHQGVFLDEDAGGKR